MRENRLRGLLDAGKPTLGTRIHSVWPSVVEAIGHTRSFDYVEFEAEYAPFDLHDLDGICRAAELHDLTPIIKVDQEPRTFLAQRAIGAGFQGVLFADCRSAADARACIAIARPETPMHGGTYGVASRRMAYMGYGGSADYVKALEQVVVALMIEKKGAVEDLDEILSLPDISMVQFGSFDYAMSSGLPGGYSSAEIRAVELVVIKRCQAAGVAVRAEIASPKEVERYRELDVRHFALGVDFAILHGWWRDNGRVVREIINAL
ncbi:MAG: aldolase/citrate lyase family protein [Verrucomicrobia bacterium]|nr:aldolase/citrate lyase family protein [Verrucomicrobiota bacterium]